MKLLLLALLLINQALVFGQSTIPVPSGRDSSQLNIEFLSGHWENDSFKTRIEFKVAGRELSLLANSYYTYHFFITGTFPLQGVTATWPPNDCSIKK